MTGFRDLGLCNELGEAVEKMGVLAPSELDCAGIPAVLEGKNVVFGYLDEPERALAYLLPLIQVLFFCSFEYIQSFGTFFSRTNDGFEFIVSIRSVLGVDIRIFLD